jgi:diaminopimelate decarboxylase
VETASRPLDLDALSRRLNERLDRFARDARFTATALELELGRYLVAEAGCYVARVVRVKASRDRTYAIVDGGMHQFLSACQNQAVLGRPFRLRRVSGAPGATTRSYDVVGPLCTANDLIAAAVDLPELAAGDLIAVECAGAYGLTLSPTGFITHAPAIEMLVEEDGTTTDISETTAVIDPATAALLRTPPARIR